MITEFQIPQNTKSFIEKIKDNQELFQSIEDFYTDFLVKKRENLQKLTIKEIESLKKNRNYYKSTYYYYISRNLIVDVYNKNPTTELISFIEKSWDIFLRTTILNYITSRKTELKAYLEKNFAKHKSTIVEFSECFKGDVSFEYYIQTDTCKLHLRTILAGGSVQVLHHRFICTKID